MNRPQSILIFLPDGSPRSVRIAEITNRVVKAILIPRNKLDYIGERDEVKNVGLYFLFGESSAKAKSIVHIFNSPSTAGGVVLGRSTNGWKKWKNTAGKTLDELKRT